MSSDAEQVVSRHIEHQPDEAAADATDDAESFTTEQWATLRSERDRYLDALQRSQADFTNYRKRVARDQAAAAHQAQMSVLSSMLPLIDAIDRARHHDQSAAALWATALEALARQDVERITPDPGDAFDPATHHAVTATGGPDGDQLVAEVVRPGYRVADTLLRPADVAVTTTGTTAGSDTDTADGAIGGDVDGEE